VDNLDVARNGVVTAKRFARARFLADVNLNTAMMPLLASAIGNDYVAVSLLRPFHVSLGDLGEVQFPESWNMGVFTPETRSPKPETRNPGQTRSRALVKIREMVSRYVAGCDVGWSTMRYVVASYVQIHMSSTCSIHI
jgi:hypothetical protein